METILQSNKGTDYSVQSKHLSQRATLPRYGRRHATWTYDALCNSFPFRFPLRHFGRFPAPFTDAGAFPKLLHNQCSFEYLLSATFYTRQNCCFLCFRILELCTLHLCYNSIRHATYTQRAHAADRTLLTGTHRIQRSRTTKIQRMRTQNESHVVFLPRVQPDSTINRSRACPASKNQDPMVAGCN